MLLLCDFHKYVYFLSIIVHSILFERVVWARARVCVFEFLYVRSKNIGTKSQLKAIIFYHRALGIAGSVSALALLTTVFFGSIFRCISLIFYLLYFCFLYAFHPTLTFTFTPSYVWIVSETKQPHSPVK